MKRLYFQISFWIFLLIPNFQHFGFHVYNLKVVLHAGFLFFLMLFVARKKFSKKNNVGVVLLIIFHISLMLSGSYIYMVDNLYTLIKFCSGIIVFFYILKSEEKFNVKYWIIFYILSSFIAFSQQLPVLRNIFMFLWGSVQGLNSDWPYSRSSGLTSHFYIFTQFSCILLVTINWHSNIGRLKYTIFSVFSLFSNTKSAIFFPLWLIFLKLEYRYKIFCLISFVILLSYLSTNFAPIRVIYSHLYDVYHSGNLDSIIYSKYSSFAQRVASVREFYDLFSNNTFEIIFFGIGSSKSLGQEIGFFYIISSIGLINSIGYYFLPLILMLYFVPLRIFFKYFLFIFPLFFCEFLVTGMVKYELYMIFWMSVAFIIKKETSKHDLYYSS